MKLNLSTTVAIALHIVSGACAILSLVHYKNKLQTRVMFGQIIQSLLAIGFSLWQTDRIINKMRR